MKRLLSLSAALALMGSAHAADSAATDTNTTIDPDIARASAEVDEPHHTVVPPNETATDASIPSPHTTYGRALLNYKSGKYEAARMLIDEADQEMPGNVPIELLKVRILAELGDFHTAHQTLNSLYDRSDLTPAYLAALTLTSGDLDLRERHFDEATKVYGSYLVQQPNDTDVKLKLIYAQIGTGDLISAGKLASELKPLDAASPAYYFARAALTRAGVGTEDEEQDLQQARTVYGATLFNRYLKTYLEVGAKPKSKTTSATGTAPSGKAQ